MRFRIAALALLLPAAALTTACDDPFGGDVILLPDTVSLGAPTGDSAALGSALDLAGGNVVRFPERIGDALPDPSWDVALRLSNGRLLLRPLPTSQTRPGARITGPRSVSFADADRAPEARSEYGDTAVVLEQGRVYFLRSRAFADQFAGTCVNYAKLQPLQLNPATGSARFAINTNQRCNDRRLTD